MDITELINIATTIRVNVDELGGGIDEVTKAVRSAVDTWDSDASTYLQKKYTIAMKEIEEHRKSVSDYSSFLEKSAEIMEQVDAAMNEMAEDNNWV